MHEYTVEFRIQGSDLDPSTITTALGLEPSQVRHAGDKRDQTTIWKEALWAYNGYPRLVGGKTWPSLEEGLDYVLRGLLPVKDWIDGYKLKYKLTLWCGHFQSDYSGGPTLSPAILKRLGEFGVELFIDNYFSEDVEDASVETQDK